MGGKVGLRFFEQLVKNYPNDKVASSSVLHHFLVIENYNLEQKSILKKIMQTVIEKYPDSLVADEARKLLKKLEQFLR